MHGSRIHPHLQACNYHAAYQCVKNLANNSVMTCKDCKIVPGLLTIATMD